MNRYGFLLISLFVLTVLARVSLAETLAPSGADQSLRHYEELYPFDDRIAQLETDERIRMIRPEVTVDVMIRTGDEVVLDLGAGSGFFTFPMARRLGKDGRVYAADIDPEKIELLKSRAAAGGYSQVFPVQVQSEGIDPFYATQKFDVILMSEVLEYIVDPVAFLDRLRPSLYAESGRLFIVHLDMFTPFRRHDILIPETVMNVLAEDLSSPVARRLGPVIREFLAYWPAQDTVPQNLLDALAVDFNRMMEDPSLSAEINAYMDAREKMAGAVLARMDNRYLFLAKWLAYVSPTMLVPGKADDPPECLQTEVVSMMNRLLLLTWFGASALRNPQDPIGFVRAWYQSKAGLLNIMQRAGFKLVADHNLHDNFYFLEFARSR